MGKNELANLKEVLELSLKDKIQDSSSYFNGLVNGMILAVAILEHKEPQYVWKKKKEVV